MQKSTDHYRAPYHYGRLPGLRPGLPNRQTTGLPNRGDARAAYRAALLNSIQKPRNSSEQLVSYMPQSTTMTPQSTRITTAQQSPLEMLSFQLSASISVLNYNDMEMHLILQSISLAYDQGLDFEACGYALLNKLIAVNALLALDLLLGNHTPVIQSKLLDPKSNILTNKKPLIDLNKIENKLIHPVSTAIKYNNHEAIKKLVLFHGKNTKILDELETLHQAVLYQHEEMITTLLGLKANINLKNEQLETPLMLAVSTQASWAVITILSLADKTHLDPSIQEEPLDLNPPGEHNQTAPHYAVRQRNLLSQAYDEQPPRAGSSVQIPAGYFQPSRTSMDVLQSSFAPQMSLPIQPEPSTLNPCLYQMGYSASYSTTMVQAYPSVMSAPISLMHRLNTPMAPQSRLQLPTYEAQRPGIRYHNP